MKRKHARMIFGALRDSASDEFGVEVISAGRKRVAGFRFAEASPLVGAVTATRADGFAHHFLLVEWKPNQGFNLVVYAADRSGPLAVIHRLVETGEVATLHWTCAPTKRDGRNPERKAYFERHFLSCYVALSVPRTQDEAEPFLEEVFGLVESRLSADRLDRKSDPIGRDTFPEGRAFEQRHLRRERSGRLVAEAKRRAKERFGELKCQICGFDFAAAYGAVGDGYIEGHHTIPVSELMEGSRTRVEDLALVCANCHRMLHRRRPWLTTIDLQRLLPRSRTRRGSGGPRRG